MSRQEEKIREHVRELRSFYTNTLIFSGVSVLSILAWLLSGGGKFWPIWVLIGSGLAVGLQAFRLGMTPVLEEWFPFLTTAWEDQKTAVMLKEEHDKATPMVETATEWPVAKAPSVKAAKPKAK